MIEMERVFKPSFIERNVKNGKFTKNTRYELKPELGFDTKNKKFKFV